MSTINGVGSVDTSLYMQNSAVQGSTQKTADEKEVKESAAREQTGVIYEASSGADKKTDAIYSDRTQIIEKMKADAARNTENLRSIVEKLMLGQSKAYTIATDDEDNMWKFLASGQFEVDPETKAQAQADIAEDGYWGVEQTSDRILDFAKALAGNDPAKGQELLDAFKKGYEQAEKTWGGKLPDISKRTYEAVEKKFNEWMNPVTEADPAKDQA
ncbi:MAG: hypothetical protein IJS86_01385 [Lachnospiraceae bacterium]|nr:hypothetical protein [Lachnospiraceae bacterium]